MAESKDHAGGAPVRPGRTRRGLLAGAAGALGVLAAETLAPAQPAAATQGQAVIEGTDNTGATARTGIFTTGNKEWAQLADPGNAGLGSQGVYGVGQNTGVRGEAVSGPGVVGMAGVSFGASGGNNVGVAGFGSGTGAGVTGSGGATSGTGVFGAGGASNGAGVKGEGSGTGAGVTGTGGTSNGPGVEGFGGATSGDGVAGFGTGVGAGVFATGGTSNGPGVFGIGGGAGAGVSGQGGGSGGTGVSGEGGATSGTGVRGTGGPSTGTGVIGTGGSGGGTGVVGLGTGTSGIGVNGLGAGTGAGVFGESASVAGAGVLAENTAGGNALQVIGKAAFNRSGILTVAAGASSDTVTGVALSSASLVLATLQQNLSGVYVRSAVPNVAGSSLTVHLSKAVSVSASVAWFVVN